MECRPMIVDALRFVGSGRGEVSGRIELDARRLDELLRSEAGPAVFVVDVHDLRRLLAIEAARERFSHRKQHGGKGLGHYFQGDAPVALEAKYAELGRLRGALRSHLASARV